jgi:glutamate synthase (ferredoxin)
VGRCDLLEMRAAIDHYKARGLDYSKILARPAVGPEVGRYRQVAQDHALNHALDLNKLLPLCEPALKSGTPVRETLPILNVNRVTGTILGSEVSLRYGADGLPDDTIHLHFQGSAGQSFAAFVPRGITLELEGDANDYLGKGLSGGRILLYPPRSATFKAEDNVIAGNVAFYGATAGEAFIRGIAGERFLVRNSGVKAVVEGVGDHCCEYMTGGQVIVLGRTGRNFAAGMSGGIAYVYDADGSFATRCNMQMVNVYSLVECLDTEIAAVQLEIERHVALTGSQLGAALLADWQQSLPRFRKVLPKDYERMLQAFADVERSGLSGEEAVMAAFEANIRDTARVGGN